MDQEEAVRCAIYTRKSQKVNTEQVLNSLEAQRLACEEYIKKRQGFIILPKKYDDNGCTGANLERSGIQELMRDVVKGKVDCVVIYKLDRLSRDEDDGDDVTKLLKKYRVSLISITQPIDTSTRTGQYLQRLMFLNGELERGIIIDRVSDKIATCKKNGLRMGGSVALGYDAKNKRLVINEEEAKLVKYIFTRFKELESVTELVRELNSQGYRTKRRVSKEGKIYGGDKYFEKNILYKMLRNPIYLGKSKHKDELYEGKHEAIIDEELWNNVQAKRKNCSYRKTKYKSGLLKSVIRCQRCDVNMMHTWTKKESKRYKYYKCNNHCKGMPCPSMNRIVPAWEVEKLVMENIQKNLINGSETLGEVWEHLFPCRQEEIIKKLIRTVWVREDGIEVFLESETLEEMDIDNDNEINGEMSIFIPCEFKRGTGKCTIIEPKNSDHVRKENNLIEKLVSAHLYQRQLNEGKCTSELSEGETRPERVYKILKLTLLAPRIQEDILNGKQPSHLKWESFKNKKIPILWNDQLKEFYGIDGFYGDKNIPLSTIMY